MNHKITIITVVRNGASTIRDCINSVQLQTHPVEHILIDGASSDSTMDVVNEFQSCISKIISEPDDGIYHAMNKGIKLASGEIIGILNADDFYVDPHVISKVSHAFSTFPVDALFADLVFVPQDNPTKTVRYYSGANFTLKRFAFGWMPPHPTFFVRRECYEKFDVFKMDYKIAADFELMARFLVKHRINFHYLPEVIIKMRTGGVSTRNFRSNIILNREIMRACAENDIKTNYLRIYSKYFRKILQLVQRPK